MCAAAAAAAAEHCYYIMIPIVSNYCSDLGNLDWYGLSGVFMLWSAGDLILSTHVSSWS